MEMKLSKDSVLIEYLCEKRKGLQLVKIKDLNEHITDISRNDICIADISKATNVTYENKEMAFINYKYIKVKKVENE